MEWYYLSSNLFELIKLIFNKIILIILSTNMSTLGKYVNGVFVSCSPQTIREYDMVVAAVNGNLEKMHDLHDLGTSYHANDGEPLEGAA